MAKFPLVADPTFKLKVPFPIAGAEPVPVELTLKHRSQTELAAFMKPQKDRKDADVFMDMVEGWGLEDAFSRENVEKLLGNHLGIAVAVFNAYVQALVNPGATPKEWLVAKV